MNGKNKKKLYIGIGVLAIFLAWCVASLAVNSEFVFPTPWTVGKEFLSLLAKADFYLAVSSTALRALSGFAVSVLLAFGLSVLAFKKPNFHTAFSPTVTVIRAVPTMSVILLTFVWFAPVLRPIFIGFLIAFPLLYESFHSALCGVDKKMIEMSKIFEASPATKLKYLYIPLSRDGFLSGMKNGISLNLKVVISAEVMVNTVKSMGWHMNVAQMSTMTAELFAWTLSALLLSFLFEGIVELIRYLTRPKRKKYSICHE